MKSYCVVFYLLTILSSVQLDKILFPGETPISQNPNSNKRIPIAGSPHCPNDKYLYYPGDQESDWACDCKPTYVYYPQKDDCFPVYSRGPCNPGQYLILQGSKIIPECVRNPCVNDNLVPFNGKCETLYKSSACKPFLANLESSVLDINETTLQLECIPASSVELSIIKVPVNSCLPGSKRQSEGQCRPMIP